MPPLEAPDDAFDLAYSISVMTHITQDATDAWIRELARITKPGGVIAISLLARTLPGGVHYDARTDMGVKRSWLGVGDAPPVYLNTWHDIDRLADRWRDVVRLERRMLNAIRGKQDLLLFRPA